MKLRKLSLVAFLIAGILMSYGCQPPAATEKLVYPEEGTTGAQLHQSRCGTCHGAPHPASRKRHLWANIVYRMQTNITVSGFPPLSPSEIKLLLDYLERNAQQ